MRSRSCAADAIAKEKTLIANCYNAQLDIISSSDRFPIIATLRKHASFLSLGKYYQQERGILSDVIA